MGEGVPVVEPADEMRQRAWAFMECHLPPGILPASPGTIREAECDGWALAHDVLVLADRVDAAERERDETQRLLERNVEDMRKINEAWRQAEARWQEMEHPFDALEHRALMAKLDAALARAVAAEDRVARLQEALREIALLLRHPGPRPANSANQALRKAEAALSGSVPQPAEEKKK